MSTAAEVVKVQREWTPEKPFPLNYDETFLRNAIPDAPGMFVEGRIPFGCWTHSAPPGGYKSAVGYQFAVAVTTGSHLPGLDWDFSQRGDVLIIAPDETSDEQRDRSYRVTPFGQLETDNFETGQLAPHDAAEIHYRQPTGETLEQRIYWLWAAIRDLEATTGRKIVMIIWDTAASLAGTSEKNAYDHLEPVQKLNHDMATEQRVLMLPRHIGKDGTPIGSVGWDAYCNLNTVMDVKPGELDGKLRVNGKARGCQHWQAAVTFVNGLVGELVDENPLVTGRAKNGSQTRRVLEFLAQAAATVAEIESGTGLNNREVHRVLVRAKRAGEVEKLPGLEWALTDHGQQAGPPDGAPIRWEENGKTFGTCSVCNRRMLVIATGQTTHPTCEDEPDCVPEADNIERTDTVRYGPTGHPIDPVTCLNALGDRSGPDACVVDHTEPAADVEPDTAADGHGACGWCYEHQNGRAGECLHHAADQDEGTDAERFQAFKSLEASIRHSKKRPVLWIKKEQRDAAPWSLITERMSGEHRHRVDAPADSVVTVLDRRGSYPSAMSNVPVSANLLTHTGPARVLDTARAGIYQVPAFTWDDPRIGHPLGKIANYAADTWWIATPHMRLLRRLHEKGVIAEPTILDSWTGLTATNLFEGFYIDVREARKATEDDEAARTEVKRMSSVATRALWLKNEALRSPFWRPDWSVSVRAEASVRHWMRAWQAVQGGAKLVGLRAVDEAIFVVPAAAAMGSWVPEPYVVGPDYGNVSIKSLLTCEEWNGARR